MAFLETNNLLEDHVHNFQELLVTIKDLEEKKKILRQAAKSFRYGPDVGIWVNDLFEPQSYEWLYFNGCLFVYIHDGWLHGLHYIDYLKRAYDANPNETIDMLKEILGYYLSDEGYSYSFSGNLINALSELQVEEAIVQDLLQTTFQIVKRRLPHPPNSEIKGSIYLGLDSFNRDEMVVALLIARLKTLTTEKTQGIIWSLTFLAQKAPNTLIKPFLWAFSNHLFLLPIHRSVLLQILMEYVDQRLIPDVLTGQLISSYPSGFFLEDQYIRSFVDYTMELDENSASFTLFTAHQYDKGFFPYIHLKYSTLVKHFGGLSGTYNAYIYRRDKISKENNSYFIKTEKIVTPIVSHANAVYEIVNSQYYDSLKHITNLYNPSYISNLRFYLEEIILQVGSLTKRPLHLPTPENIPLFEVRDSSSSLIHKEWVVLASKEVELFGEQFKLKKRRSASLVITKNERRNDEDYYARYFFTTNLYEKENIDTSPVDQPICELLIFDMLERSSIVYVSPFVVRELGLKLDFTLYNGFQARNDKGEVIIKISTWKEDYYGDISHGTEVPRLEGVAVVIKSNYYEKLLAIYQKGLRFVLRRQDRDDG